MFANEKIRLFYIYPCYYRFASTLTETKMIGIRKGILVGLCQGLATLLSYCAFAIIAWY